MKIEAEESEACLCGGGRSCRGECETEELVELPVKNERGIRGRGDWTWACFVSLKCLSIFVGLGLVPISI